MANPSAWKGMRYPDSDLVGLVYRFARPVGAEKPFAVDVGCGAGRHVRFLQDVGYRAVGIDSDAAMCEMARQNGVDVLCADVSGFSFGERPDLVVAWGLTMLIRQLPDILAAWQPRIIILDWRTKANTCMSWPGNVHLESGAIRLNNVGHVLHGQEYHFVDLADCQVPGYERVHWQRVSRVTMHECNEWYQTVHQRQE